MNENGPAEYQAPDHDVAALGQCIVQLLEDPELRRRLGERAYATIAGNLDWMTLARGIEVLYRHMLERKQPLDADELRRYIKPSYR